MGRSYAKIYALLWFVVLSGWLLGSSAYAVQPGEQLPQAELEQRARKISAELRCLVCQNESIDDSDAPLARDLRLLVRSRLTLGDSNQEVKDFIVDRYGEFVLLRPIFGWHTALLWLGPFAILCLGGIAIAQRARKQQNLRAAPLTPEEEEKLSAMLGKE